MESGTDLQEGEIKRDDVDVLCKASLEWGSEGVIVRMGGPRVVVNGGKMGRITGVSCWKESA